MDEYQDIRDGVTALCADFPGEYWQKMRDNALDNRVRFGRAPGPIRIRKTIQPDCRAWFLWQAARRLLRIDLVLLTQDKIECDLLKRIAIRKCGADGNRLKNFKPAEPTYALAALFDLMLGERRAK